MRACSFSATVVKTVLPLGDSIELEVFISINLFNLQVQLPVAAWSRLLDNPRGNNGLEPFADIRLSQ